MSCVLSLSCQRRGQSDYDRPLPPGTVGIRQVAPQHWPTLNFPTPGSKAYDQYLLGIERSLTFLSKPSSQSHFPIGPVNHQQVVDALTRLQDLMQQRATANEILTAIRNEFICYSAVGYDDAGTVLFTGYYTPIFSGSRKKTEQFRFPLHKRPNDLVPGPDHLTIAQRRLADGTTETYPARAELMRDQLLAGQELVYLEGEFDAYIISVQGSGRIRLQDGSVMEVGYNGTNGYEYYPISDDLISDGIVTDEQRSLATIRAYFREHPDTVRRYTDKNPRYIFFTETSGGPFGSLGQPVVANVSIATDKTIFPRAAPVFVTQERGRGQLANGWRLDQDTGGAIRAAGRCDLYFGIGQQAESLAGEQMSFGRMYYFVRR